MNSLVHNTQTGTCLAVRLPHSSPTACPLFSTQRTALLRVENSRLFCGVTRIHCILLELTPSRVRRLSEKQAGWKCTEKD